MQRRFVDLIGDFRDDQRVTILPDRFDVDLAAHSDRTASSQISGADAGASHDDAARREVRAGHVFHELFDSDIGGLKVC